MGGCGHFEAVEASSRYVVGVPPHACVPRSPSLCQAGEANAKASLALRQIEAEITLRGIHDGIVTQREAAVMVALQALCDLLRNDPAGVAAGMVQGTAQWVNDDAV